MLLSALFSTHSSSQVKVGAELLLERHRSLLTDKKIGLVTNHTAVLSNGAHLVDTLASSSEWQLVALFGPEHGVRGDVPAGEKVQHGVDAKTGIKVFSLYGAIHKPTPEMLKGIDILLFDIQDIGARFYTYLSTMTLAMEAAAEQKVPFLVLDRPNPIRGTWVEGFLLEDSLRSFVGPHPIPIAHGMTMGELAAMINDEGWLTDGMKADLRVYKMKNWKREMWYDQTGLTWVQPSPNMKTLATAIVYPGMCLVEGTNVSEGRGTDRPFEYIGAPFIDGRRLAETLNQKNLPGAVFEPIEFTPREIPHAAVNPKHKGIKCGGVFVSVTDRNTFEPVRTAVFLLAIIKQMYPSEFQWRERAIDLLAGTPSLRLAIDRGDPPETIVREWQSAVEQFKKQRSKYLFY
ncbi:MAG TPA: DUF1343 domain-containing protein [Bacteroidota bacterium]|nr:DUF1343 domain-containing protein [Bacteroidota bacterium]